MSVVVVVGFSILHVLDFHVRDAQIGGFPRHIYRQHKHQRHKQVLEKVIFGLDGEGEKFLANVVFEFGLMKLCETDMHDVISKMSS